MKIRHGDTALITGASRGIGRHIAAALAERGMDLVLVARSAAGLDSVADEIRSATDVSVTTLTADLNDREQTTGLLDRIAVPIDLLVNNAGVEATRRFEERSTAEIAMFTEVNLLAPMLLTHAVLPGMVERGRGHIVNLASIAGLLPSAYEEPYNATKYGLVGFTRALRLTARDRGWAVSASAVCPGFTEGAGMFADMREEFGITAPGTMGSLPVERVAAAVIRAVEQDLPDVIVMRGTPRLTAATATLAPRTFERIAHRLDLAAPFRTIAEKRSTTATSTD